MARRKSYRLVTFCCLILLIIGFAYGYYINLSREIEDNNKISKLSVDDSIANGEKFNKQVSDKREILGSEDISNNEMIDGNNITPANIDDQKQKVSVSTKMIFKSIYLGCNHETVKEDIATEDIINMTEDQLKEIYFDWEIENFDSNQVILKKVLGGKCPNHYIVKEYDGKVGLFYQNPTDGNGFIKDITSINISQLRHDDREKLIKGIRINSDEELARLVEDFAS